MSKCCSIAIFLLPYQESWANTQKQMHKRQLAADSSACCQVHATLQGRTNIYHIRMSAPLAPAFAIAIASVTVGGSGNVMECNCGLLVSKCRSLLWKPSDVVQNNGAVVGNTMHAHMDLRLLVGVLRITVSISAQGYAVIKLLYKIVFFFVLTKLTFCSHFWLRPW